jgi:hypothetical protein
MTRKAWRRMVGLLAVIANVLVAYVPEYVTTLQCARIAPQFQLYTGTFAYLLASALFLSLAFEMKPEFREKVVCSGLLFLGVDLVLDSSLPECPTSGGSINTLVAMSNVVYFCYLALAALSVRDISDAALHKP